MEWTPLATISICWILYLMTWSIFLLKSDLLQEAMILAALVVAEMSSLIVLQTQATREATCVTTVGLCSPVLLFTSRCLAKIYQSAAAITNGFITGTSAYRSYFLWRVKFHTHKCYELLKSCVMARTRLSTKIRCDRYSDL